MNPVQLMRRHEQLKTRRQTNVETVWRDCFDYTYPTRGAQLRTGTTGTGGMTQALPIAATKQADLNDATGTDATRILASALVSALTPSNSRWFELEVDNADDAGKTWLEGAGRCVWKNIHASNYDSTVYEVMVDEVCAGMGPMFVDEDPKGGYRFDHWPLAQCFFASSVAGGPVDVVHREISLTGEQALKEYGRNLSANAYKRATDNLDETIDFVWCIYPRPAEEQSPPFAKGLPFASCHVEKASKTLVRESGFHEQPIIVPRWHALPDSAYATGPVFEALPDMKTLNELIRLQMWGMDIAVCGMWIAEDDGILNPRAVKVGPRKIIVASSVDSMKELKSSADMSKSLMEIERLQKAIRRTLMADQLTPTEEGPQMTATEVTVRVELIRQLLGPVYGRMQSEFIQMLVARCFGLAFRAGVFTEPPDSLRGKSWTLKYTSPLARAQRMVDAQAMDRFEGSIAQSAALRPEVLDNYDWDAAVRFKAEALGVPHTLLVDSATRDNKRQAQAEAAQQQAQQAAMAGMVNTPEAAPAMGAAAQAMR